MNSAKLPRSNQSKIHGLKSLLEASSSIEAIKTSIAENSKKRKATTNENKNLPEDGRKKKKKKKNKSNHRRQDGISTPGSWSAEQRLGNDRRFGDLVTIQERERAIAYANTVTISEQYYQVFWTDASISMSSPSPSSSLVSFPSSTSLGSASSASSVSSSPTDSGSSESGLVSSSLLYSSRVFAGGSVVYTNPPETSVRIKTFGIEGVRNIDHAELLAVSAAIQLAVEAAEALKKSPKVQSSKKMAIFTDSQYALKKIADMASTGDITKEITLKITQNISLLRQLGVELELRWVPAHRRVPGNVLADRMAKNAVAYIKKKQHLGSISSGVHMFDVPELGFDQCKIQHQAWHL